jgi:hypothetical protein
MDMIEMDARVEPTYVPYVTKKERIFTVPGTP